MRPRSSRAVLLVVLAPVLAAGACSSSGSKGATSTAPTTSGSPATTQSPAPTTTVAPVAGTAITIKGFAFQPPALGAKVGDTVVVTNADGTEHSLTAVDGSFDTGRFAGGTKTVTLAKAGRFEFKCQVHSFMPHGFIQVSG